MREGRHRIWTIPNALTMLRLALIPVFWVLMMTRDNEYAALAVFVVASLTDLLDGHIARKYNLITNFGMLFDPLADKVMVLSVLFALTLKGILPWPPLAVLLPKEVIMVVGSYLLLKRHLVVYAKPVGKFAQFFIVVALGLSFFHEHFQSFPIHVYMLVLGVILSLVALAYYVHGGIQAVRAMNTNNTNGGVHHDE